MTSTSNVGGGAMQTFLRAAGDFPHSRVRTAQTTENHEKHATNSTCRAAHIRTNIIQCVQPKKQRIECSVAPFPPRKLGKEVDSRLQAPSLQHNSWEKKGGRALYMERRDHETLRSLVAM
eukprot:CAMPEP_0174939916 /NCGR_PEP_ID=MMETSP1355-20121228/67820_1 /TAXON_ID=464990 /ORGANISM="Hemiselmis tepida, Strain CCMP443" /LENGTH=119 /DNA_ID=CAMNT_0016186957 /DNA_START=43 /DNA_END=402 /DNA_ORIENTATION=+